MTSRAWMRRAQLLAMTTTFADVATPLVLPWYGYTLSHSLALMAVMFLAEALLPVGVGLGLSARLGQQPPGRLVRIGQGGRAVIFLGLLGTPWIPRHWLSWTVLALAAGLNGLCSVLAEAAIQSAIPGEGSALTDYAARLQRAITVTKMVGAPIGGALVSGLGPAVTLGVLAITALGTSLVGPWWLRDNREGAMGPTPRGRWSDGVRRLWGMPTIRSLALQAMAGNFGWALVMSGFLFYLLQTLRVTGVEVSAVYFLIALGGVGGTIVVSPLLGRFRRGQLYPLFLTGGVLGLVLLQWHNPWMAGIGEGMVGLCDTAWVILSTGVRLEQIPTRDRPLILTTSRLMSNTLVPAGGLVVALWGMQWGFSVLFAGAALVKAVEVVIAMTTAVGRIDADACCARAATRVAEG